MLFSYSSFLAIGSLVVAGPVQSDYQNLKREDVDWGVVPDIPPEIFPYIGQFAEERDLPSLVADMNSISPRSRIVFLKISNDKQRDMVKPKTPQGRPLGKSS
jgi:hypothetical protein